MNEDLSRGYAMTFYSVTVARTPSVGVGGSILHGGYSWMGSDLGFISDPVNFIDAEVVKYDGTIVMASTEPELMWALRGSGGGFGSKYLDYDAMRCLLTTEQS